MELEGILCDNVGKTVHPNHFLMGTTREKLVTCHLRRRQKLVQMLGDPVKSAELAKMGKLDQVHQEILKCFLEQLKHFRDVALVMEKIDFPSEFWQDSLKKMESEAEEAKSLYKCKLYE